MKDSSDQLQQRVQRIIRLESRYARLLELRMEHPYYSSGLCPDLIIRPSDTTEARLFNYGLVFRPTEGGFTLLMNLARDLSSGIFAAPLQLDFDCTVTNPLFLNFTDIPFLTGQQMQFSNTYPNNLLHPGNTVDNQVLYTAANEGLSGTISLIINQDGTLFGPLARSVQFITYRIVFAARSTRWRYLCHGNEDYIARLHSFRILSRTKDGVQLSFGRPEPATLLNGRQGFSLTANEDLPQTERPQQRHLLIADASGVQPGYQRQLPNAAPEQLRYHPEEDQFYSYIIHQL